MLLPNADRAEIDPEKLHGYLLSTSHPVGRFKARFFEALGYSAERWEEFADALRTQHLTQEATASGRQSRGQAYTIRAMLKRPDGQTALVVSVWFIPNAADVPRFVTAYPGGKS